ncbi:TRAP transporter substrate-binding protein [Paenibacillus ferrarius]|uniref:TRAP transporter substrate-binding protein n=1 Tax=Paenibacillus ferrarius TaxID=1469647 RepID=UPI003D2A5E1B
MRIGKKSFLFLTSVMLVSTFLLSACGSSSKRGETGKDATPPQSSTASVKAKVLKFSHTDTPNGARQQTAELFAKKVEEYTQGRYKVEVFHSGQLANDAKALEMLQNGSIDLTVAGNIVYANHVKEFNLTSLPYLVDTYEQGWKFYDESPWMQETKGKFVDKGMRILSTWEAGFRNFTTKDKFETLADVKGKKLRIFQNDMILWTMKALGFNPVTMPVTEAYLAIQQGTVDGQENPVDTIYSQKFNEVAPYITMTQHIYGPIPLAISEKTWKTIPKEDQDAIAKAAQESADFSRKTVTDNETKLLDEMKAKGAKVFTPNLDELKQAVKPVYDKASEVYTKEVVDRVLKDAENIKAKYPKK